MLYHSARSPNQLPQYKLACVSMISWDLAVKSGYITRFMIFAVRKRWKINFVDGAMLFMYWLFVHCTHTKLGLYDFLCVFFQFFDINFLRLSQIQHHFSEETKDINTEQIRLKVCITFPFKKIQNIHDSLYKKIGKFELSLTKRILS